MINRYSKKEAIAALLLAPKGTLDALLDLLLCQLEDARQEMEAAQDAISVWRCQGRCIEIHNLLAAIKQREKI